MITFLKTAFDTLFPPHPDVMRVRKIDEDFFIQKLIVRTKPLPWIFCGFSYHDPDVRALVRANKFYGDTKATRVLGKALGEILTALLEEKALLYVGEPPLLIPIPSSGARRQKRGYNQVERIVKEALPSLQGTVRYRDTLMKREERKSQTHVEKKERAQNIARAFMIPKEKAHEVKSAICILVDDISESGSTLIDARRALKAAGAREVVGVVIAH